MPATVRDLRVDGPHAGLASSSLCDGQGPLVLAVDARRLDLLACRERGKGFEAEVDAYLAGAMLPVLHDLDLQIQIPPTSGVFGEASAEDVPIDATAKPEPVSSAEESYRMVLQSNGARSLEWDPPQGRSTSPSRALSADIPGYRELLAHRLHGIRVQAEEFGAAAGELDQIEARGRTLIMAASGALDLAAVVPDPINCRSLSREKPTGGRILDPVPVRKHHWDRIVGI